MRSLRNASRKLSDRRLFQADTSEVLSDMQEEEKPAGLEDSSEGLPEPAAEEAEEPGDNHRRAYEDRRPPEGAEQAPQEAEPGGQI